jgi:glyceraldehyde-3-phosphate dehydrogenase type I
MHKLAINGFGRIGRLFLRAAMDHEDFGKTFEIVAINDLTDAPTLAHLLKYDSVHGVWKRNVTASGTTLAVDGHEMRVTAEKSALNLPWKELGVEFVVEATGAYKDKEEASSHITAGASKILISAPAKGVDGTFVMGVNHKKYDAKNHSVVSMGSCTTNSIAPPLMVLQNAFGITRGLMTTIHSYTNDQRILDLPHKDLRRARAAALNIIPTSTGAAKAIGEVIPELKGKMDGTSLRVPTPDVSISDLSLVLNKEVTKDEVNAVLKAAANGPLKGILEYTEDPIVSSDVISNPHTSVIDGDLTNVSGGKSNFVKIFAWYDNEWAFSVKMAEFLIYMASQE